MTGTTTGMQEPRGALVWVPLGRIYDNPFQTRLAYDDEHIERLAESIWSLRDELTDTRGLQQPPVARVARFGPDGDAAALDRSAYADPAALRRRLAENGVVVELHFGHNRLRAWRLLRNRDGDAYATFPLLLAYADDRAMWRHAVAENAQRKDISPVEEAATIRVAIERFNMTQEQAGEPFGYARATVTNKLRLLNLPERLRAELQAGHMSERHGRALLRLAPAPHLWESFTRSMLDVSVAELEVKIEELIARCAPLPPAPRTGYKYARQIWYGGEERRQILTDKFDPPAWPYDWVPEHVANLSERSAIVGACKACKFYATFGGDAGARCTLVEGLCKLAKDRQWTLEQQAKQAAALRRSSPADVPDTGSGGGAGDGGAATSDNNGLSDVSQETSPALDRISTEVAADRGVENTSEVTWFTTKGYGAAPAALLQKGLCSVERCECMVVAYNRYADDSHVRPDPEHAPNMCVGCKSSARMANRRKELEVGDLQEHRKRMKAEQEEARRLLDEALTTYTADELWHNRVVIRAIAKGNIEIEGSYKINDNYDLATIQEMIFKGIAWYACSIWEGRTRRWSLEKVQAWLHGLAVGAGRVQPSIGMVDERLLAPQPDGEFCVWQFNAQTGIGPAWESSCGRVIDDEASQYNDATTCWQCGKPIRVLQAA